MIAFFNQKPFLFGFGYHFVTLAGKRLRITSCYVKEPTGKQVGTGRAMQSPMDNDCKETARKIALTMALRNQSKEFRKAMWDGYFNRRTEASIKNFENSMRPIEVL